MKITTFSDYALRVLICLAVNPENKSTADEIAKAYDISFHHVAKAAQWLAREGYVKSERGRFGGISLLQPVENINIGQLVKGTESGTALVDCMSSHGGTCCIKPFCGLKLALAEAQVAFYQTLESFTLANVITQKSALSKLLVLSS